MYRRALQGREERLGPDHTSTLATVNNLGNLYASQGKIKEAEDLYQRALQGYEKALGPNHKSTIYTVNILGIFYSRQGKLDEAEMYLRVLRWREEALGPNHTATVATANTLGQLYKSQGKRKDAKRMFQRATQGNEVALNQTRQRLWFWLACLIVGLVALAWSKIR